MKQLEEIRTLMTEKGWTNQGGPDAVKLDSEGNVIAERQSNTWVEDFQNACDTIIGRIAFHELVRRSNHDYD